MCEKRATGRMGLGCVPIEALASWIHFLQQKQSLALIHTDRRTCTQARPDAPEPPHHAGRHDTVCDDTNIAYSHNCRILSFHQSITCVQTCSIYQEGKINSFLWKRHLSLAFRGWWMQFVKSCCCIKTNQKLQSGCCPSSPCLCLVFLISSLN